MTTIISFHPHGKVYPIPVSELSGKVLEFPTGRCLHCGRFLCICFENQKADELEQQ